MSVCEKSGVVNAQAGKESTFVANKKHLDEVLAGSKMVEEGLIQTDFVVPGMHCVGCIGSIERSISALKFVERVRANLSLKKVSVTWREGEGDPSSIDQTLSDLGFEHSLFDLEADVGDAQKQASRSLLLSLGVAGFGAANIMLLSVSVWSGADPETTTLFHLISGLIAVPVIAFAGRPFFLSAWKAVRAKRLNMDVPISLAVLLALGMSIYESLSGGVVAYFDAAVTLLFFLLIGRYLDHLMRDKARDAVVQLNRISSKGTSLVLEDGNLQYVRIDEIEIGQRVRIMAGERIPVDGKVVKGNSDLDCSLVSGESLPVQISKGMNVEAGTLNLTGAIDIQVLRDASHSFLAEVSKMMETAEKGRGRFTRIADRMARIYAPAVHLLAALAFVGWMIGTNGDWHTSIYIAISVLIITCPCALGLAVPVVHVIAARRLFNKGIIISDGAGFERMEQATRVIFDKTGTLTTGVAQIMSSSLRDPLEKEIAHALSLHSNHPAAQAVSEFLPDEHIVSLNNISEFPGFGMQAFYKGKEVRLGQAKWVGEISGHHSNIYKDGLSFCVEQGDISTFEMNEELSEGAVAAVQELQSIGFEVEIVSGDGEKPVRTIAKMLEISKFRFGQTPSEKLSYINKLQDDGDRILMVGDGLNDAPALVGAHVSVAPSKACDVGRHAADFVFTYKSLLSVPFAYKISRQAGAIVRQNFALAIIYNVIAVPFAMAGYVTPLVAAIAMSASSIVVVANSMRLSRDTELS